MIANAKTVGSIDQTIAAEIAAETAAESGQCAECSHDYSRLDSSVIQEDNNNNSISLCPQLMPQALGRGLGRDVCRAGLLRRSVYRARG